MKTPLGAVPAGFLQLLGGEAAARTISFFAIWLVVGRLGGDAYAPVAVALATMVFASLVVECGLPLIGARELSRDARRVSGLVPAFVSTQLGMALFLYLLVLVAGASGVLGSPLGSLLKGYGISLFLLPILAPWVFQGLGRLSWVAASAIIRQSVFLAACVFFVRDPADLFRLPAAEVAAVACAALVSWVGLRRAGASRILARPLAPSSALLAEALPIALSQLLWLARMYFATLMLWNAVPATSLSSFDIAQRILLVLQAFLGTYLTSVYPDISRAAGSTRDGALTDLLRRSVLRAGAVSATVALGVAVSAPAVLGRLMGGGLGNSDTWQCTAVLAFVLPVLALRGHVRLALLAIGRARMELLSSAAGVAALIVLVPLGVQQAGVVGAAYAMLVAEVIGALITLGALRVTLRLISQRDAGARSGEPA